MFLVDKINSLLKKNGAELVRFPNGELKRRKALLNSLKINKVLDIGANVGQYAYDIRELGYKGEIISFEPIKAIFQTLEKNTKKDSHWKCENFALGDSDGETEINIAGNDAASSSILEMLPSHLKSAPQSKYIGKETILVKRLDTVFNNYFSEGDNVYLKIDAQGFEKNILDGATNTLNKINVLQVELSMIPLYKDALNYIDMIEFLKSIGFELYGIEQGFSDQESGRLLQFDGIFVKNKLIDLS